MKKKPDTAICPSCGAENPAENKFCESCGVAMEQDDTSAASKKKSKKKIIIAITVGVLLLAAVTVAGIFFAGDKEEAKYNTKITEADKYLEDQEYEKAETAYLEAIDIDPKQEPAYLKLADTYVEQHKEGEALSILETATQELPDSKKIKAKYDEIDSSDYVQAMKAYDEFLSQEKLTVQYTAADEYSGEPADIRTWDSNSCDFALAYISNDKIPEMIVSNREINATKEYDEQLPWHEGCIFGYRDGKVKQINEYIFDFYDADGFGYYAGTGYYMNSFTDDEVYYENINNIGYYDGVRYTEFRIIEADEELDMPKRYLIDQPGDQDFNDVSKAYFDKHFKEKIGDRELTPYEFFENTKENREKHLLK